MMERAKAHEFLIYRDMDFLQWSLLWKFRDVISILDYDERTSRLMVCLLGAGV